MDEIVMTPIEKAINAVGGNQSELARRIGCGPQNINNIKSRGGIIPCRNKEKMDLWVKVTGLGKRTLFPQFYAKKSH